MGVQRVEFGGLGQLIPPNRRFKLTLAKTLFQPTE